MTLPHAEGAPAAVRDRGDSTIPQQAAVVMSGPVGFERSSTFSAEVGEMRLER